MRALKICMQNVLTLIELYKFIDYSFAWQTLSGDERVSGLRLFILYNVHPSNTQHKHKHDTSKLCFSTH